MSVLKCKEKLYKFVAQRGYYGYDCVKKKMREKKLAALGGVEHKCRHGRL